MTVSSLEITATAKDYERTFTTKVTQTDKVAVSHDKLRYKPVYISRITIKCKSDYRCTWSTVDKGDILGEATIRAYYLEPINTDGNGYYGIAGFEVSMDPVYIAGKNNKETSGMSQLVKVGIKTRDKDSRVCSPTASIIDAQVSNTKSKTQSFTLSAGVEFDGKWKASGNGNYTKSWGSSLSYTYNASNVELIQKDKDGDYCSWRYDYISKNGNQTWNNYLMSSSDVGGQVVYSLNQKYPYGHDSHPQKVSYDIRFGAGRMNGDVAERFVGHNRELSIDSGVISLSY